MMLRTIFLTFGILLFSQCGNIDEVIDWDNKKANWTQGLSASEEDYHVLISVPRSEDELDNLRRVEEQARFELAQKVLVPLNSELLNQLALDSRQLNSIQRSRMRMIGESMPNVVLEDTFESDSEFVASYLMNKVQFKELRKKNKSQDIAMAEATFQKALEMKSINEPQAAADFLCAAFLKIEQYLGEKLSITNELNGAVELDVLIYDEMKKLSSGLEFVLEPREKIILNRDNDYIGILNFEVHLDGHKTGRLDVSVDLAGLRQEKILTSAYSVLINDLPNVLTKPWVSLRADVFKSLREKGNELTQIVYRSVGAVSNKVAVEIMFPSVYLSSNEMDGEQSSAVEFLKESLLSANVKLMEDADSADVVLFPEVKVKSQEENSYVKLSSSWKIGIGESQVELRGKKVVSTSDSADKAQRDLLIKLDQQMKNEMLEKILASLKAI